MIFYRWGYYFFNIIILNYSSIIYRSNKFSIQDSPNCGPGRLVISVGKHFILHFCKQHLTITNKESGKMSRKRRSREARIGGESKKRQGRFRACLEQRNLKQRNRKNHRNGMKRKVENYRNSKHRNQNFGLFGLQESIL